MNSRTSTILAVAVVATMAAVLPRAEAMPPPVELALGVIGEDAGERRLTSWTLTLVDNGVTTLVSGERGDESLEFKGEKRNLEISSQAETPWNLVWAVLWSSNPFRDLQSRRRGWADESGRVEVVGGELTYCYGISEDSRLCIDTEARRIVVLAVTVDGVLWELRSSQRGERLQVTADGSLVARIGGR